MRTALSLNKHLEGSDIHVEVRGGRIALHGAVPSPGHRLLAEEIALRVAGVEHVTNTLQVSPDLAATAEPSRSLGQRLDDLTATARIKTALALHRYISAGDVAVSVESGEAVLTGTVPSWATRELVGKVVEDVEGVRSVRNDLRVEAEGRIVPPEAGGASTEANPPPTATPEDTALRQRMADGSIRLQVEAALSVNPFIEARRVHVEVADGHVMLTGTVRAETDRALIQKIAEDCWGVAGVTNEIAVEPEPAAGLQYAPPAGAARRPVPRYE